MKYTIATLLILMFFAQCNNINPRKDRIAEVMADSIRKVSIFNDTARCDKIVIDYVDEPGLGTIATVSCESFKWIFKDIKKQIVLEKGSKEFAVYDSLFSFFNDGIDRGINGIDVRLHFELYANGKSLRIICSSFSGDFYFLNTGRYYSNGPLMKYLQKNVWIKTLRYNSTN